MILPALCSDLVEDFLELNQEFRKVQNSDSATETLLKAREADFTSKIFESPEALKKLVGQSDKLEKELLTRIVERLSFKVNHEYREDLREALDGFLQASIRLTNIRKNKVINSESERKIDLSNGTWNTTPDGKKFWISNLNPEVILTPAEFQRVLISNEGKEK